MSIWWCLRSTALNSEAAALALLPTSHTFLMLCSLSSLSSISICTAQTPLLHPRSTQADQPESHGHFSKIKPHHCYFHLLAHNCQWPSRFVLVSCRVARRAPKLACQNESPNYYKLLGWRPENAGIDDIKRAYRQMSLQYHPAVCDPSMKEESTMMFIQRNAAYKTVWSHSKNAVWLWYGFGWFQTKKWSQIQQWQDGKSKSLSWREAGNSQEEGCVGN